MNDNQPINPFETERGKILYSALTEYASRTVGRERAMADLLAVEAPVELEAGARACTDLATIKRAAEVACKRIDWIIDANTKLTDSVLLVALNDLRAALQIA